MARRTNLSRLLHRAHFAACRRSRRRAFAKLFGGPNGGAPPVVPLAKPIMDASISAIGTTVLRFPA